MSENTKGRVMLYCMGGMGANIASIVYRDIKKPSPAGYADLDMAVIDTSRQNLLSSEIPETMIYKATEKDGSGGLRAENAAMIYERRLEILQKFKPSDDLNIILSSGGGGSGSVAGPIIAQELLQRGLNVVVILVGSQETVNEAKNTLKTLMSYDNAGKQAKSPLVVTYTENDAKNSVKANDAWIISRITALRVLFSRENHAMDSMDLTNWLHFNKVTTFGNVSLAGLSIIDSDTQGLAALENNVLSVATLAKDAETSVLPFRVEYQRKGFIGIDAVKDLPVHYLITNGFLKSRVAMIEQTLNEFDEGHAARVSDAPMFSRKAESGPGGLVL